MARKKNSRSSNWLLRQERDKYVRKARQEGYRSRAAYKLEQLHQRDRLFNTGDVVLDLGASPGSWSQFAAQSIGPRGAIHKSTRSPGRRGLSQTPKALLDERS